MIYALVVAAVLAAPAKPAKPPSPPPGKAVEAKPAEPVKTKVLQKLAAPGLTTADVDPARAQLINDFFADKLREAGQGTVTVLTQSEVSAVLGLERQKQLLGCSDDSASCLLEISGALGVDGIVMGNLAKFGGAYAITLKIVKASDGAIVSSASSSGLSEGQLLPWVETHARKMVRQLVPTLPPDAAPPPVVPVAEVVPGNTIAAPVGPTGLPVAIEPDKNALRLFGLGFEYNRRISANAWVGPRVSASFGGDPAGVGYLQLSVVGVARYMPGDPEANFKWGPYAVIGLGGAVDITTSSGFTDGGLQLGLGFEIGYQGLRLSAEANLINSTLVITPGLAFAITF